MTPAELYVIQCSLKADDASMIDDKKTVLSDGFSGADGRI